MIKTKRIYLPARPTDGQRILVDRLWPRGIRREDAKLDDWLKEIAPSNELRKWFNHQTERWDEFATRYSAELQVSPGAEHLAALATLASTNTITLLYAAKDTSHNNAVVLQNLLQQYED